MPYHSLSNKELAPENRNMKAVSDIESLQSRLESVLRDEPKMKDDIREILRCFKIKREYRRELQTRWGESKQIMYELSLKYFNTPYKVDFIHDVIYRKYR